MLVRLHPWKEQEKFGDASRTILQEAVMRAKFESYQQGNEDGKRRAVK